MSTHGSSENKPTDTSPMQDLAEIAHNQQSHQNETIGYPICQVEFDRVKTPFIIGIWILSASIAKIGKCFLVLYSLYIYI